MPDFSKIYLFRITHIENIPHIIQNGITHANSPNCSVDYKPIGDGSLINRRNEFYTPCGKSLGEYIPFYFTDGHAVDALSEFFTKNDIERIDEIIDKKAVKAKYWKEDTDLDLKRRKEAEFLIETDLPATAILGFAVYNDDAKNKLIEFGVGESKVIAKPNFYF